jgi:hypothetical protein
MSNLPVSVYCVHFGSTDNILMWRECTKGDGLQFTIFTCLFVGDGIKHWPQCIIW